MEATPGSDTSEKFGMVKTSKLNEEEQLGMFFQRLGNLVPWDYTASVCDDVEQTVVDSNSQDPTSLENTTRCLIKNSELKFCVDDITECRFDYNEDTTHEEVRLNSLNDTTNEFMHENRKIGCCTISNTNTITNNVNNTIPLNNNVVCPNRTQAISKQTNSSHAIKACKTRHRSAPYRLDKHALTKHTDRRASYSNSSSSAMVCPKKYNSSRPDSSGDEDRLELLTDVIAYISNLKRLLEVPKTTAGYGGGEEEDHGRTTCALDRERRADHEASYRGLESSTASAAAYRMVEPVVVPVDRAMELLEYKTGAITLTA